MIKKNIKESFSCESLEVANRHEIFNRLVKLENAIHDLAEENSALIKDCKDLKLSRVAFLLENGFIDFSFRLSFCEEFVLNEIERIKTSDKFMGCEVTK